MPKLTKADAARQLDIARSTLYKLIQQGKVSPTPDGLVDQAELVRVAAYVDILKGRLRTPTRHPHYHRVRRLTDIRRHMTANARSHPMTDVRRRRRTSSWTSSANRSRSYVTNSRKRDAARKQLATGKPSCSRCSKTCSSATIVSSICHAAVRHHPHEQAPRSP